MSFYQVLHCVHVSCHTACSIKIVAGDILMLQDSGSDMPRKAPLCIHETPHLCIYRSQTQKWELFAACLQHLQLVIVALQPGMVQPQSNSQSTPPPGLSVMLDMLRKPLSTTLTACAFWFTPA